MEKFVDYNMCKKCGGVCCKQNGCVYLPKDFKELSFESVKQLLNEGNISISGQPINGFYGDAWTFMLYLRARNQNSEIVDLIPSGSPCKMLTENGCAYDESKRPSMGLLVKPTIIGGPCKVSADDTIMTLDWLDYNEILSKLVKYYTNKDVINIIYEEMMDKLNKIDNKQKQMQELKEMEKVILYYCDIIDNKPYCTPEQTKQLMLGSIC